MTDFIQHCWKNIMKLKGNRKRVKEPNELIKGISSKGCC